MSRIYTVQRSRKERTCHAGDIIPVGSTYRYTAPGFRGREIYACAEHPFRESQLTTSLASEPLAAREALFDELDAIPLDGGLDSLDGIREAWETFSSAVRDYADQREESLDAWENGNSQLEELRDIAEQAADEAESWEVEDWTGDEDDLDWDEEEPDLENGEAHDEWTAQQEQHEAAVEDLEQHIEGQINEARETAEGLEF